MNKPVSPARRAAMEVLGRCRRFDAWSTQSLQSAIVRHGLDGRDAALCTRLCRSVLQNAALCDFYLQQYCRESLHRLEPLVLDALRLGVCQLLFLDRIPVSAAVNESAELVRAGSPRAVGLVNAVLRRVAENREKLPPVPNEGSAEYLSVQYSHPLWLCERLAAEHGYDFTRRFLAANNTPAPLTVTMNPLRGGGEARSVTLEEGGAVQQREGFAEGRFFVQDAAAALTVFSAAPRCGMRVLDGCAAPGGKSFLSAILMENCGEVLSCDLHENKLRLVKEGAARLGISILRTQAMDGSRPLPELEESFDLVLADVPCSGLGVIRRKPEIRYKAQQELARLPEKQLAILTGLSRCVKPGGVLHYSTCTILSEENRGVVDAFLQQQEDFILEEDRTLWPHVDGTDGFYLCRMRKNA